MNYPKVLTIQDISCVGQCSLTVALPVLSACGMETCVLPSAVLSTHTSGFKNFTCRDLTDDMPAIAEHWNREHIKFDAIYTGYLGSKKQIDYVMNIFKTCSAENCNIFVDPAMADNGVLYPAFDAEYVTAIKPLCFHADIMLPNLTEACFLTDTPYQENYDEAYVTEILNKLKSAGAKTIILTGISYAEQTTGVIIAEENKPVQYYQHKKIARNCHGTGDIYASAFVGAYLHGLDAYESAKIAADYTVSCIEKTQDDASHWYGVKFELALPELISRLH